MSENTKFNLEHAIKQGYRVTDDFAASRLMFEKKHYSNNTDWQVFIDWSKGNYQELYLNALSGNQWVEMLNPGSAGIYYLLIRKGTPVQHRANFGRHNGSTAPYLEWLGEPLTDERLEAMAIETALLITFFWDGTKYIAHIIPKEVVGRVPKNGYLYNWGAVISGKLDIPGYHIPSRSELAALNDAIHHFDNWVGYWLKAETPVWDGGDYFGFKGLPTGDRWENGDFSPSQAYSYFWSKSEYDGGLPANDNTAYSRALQTVNQRFDEGLFPKKGGLSIRLMRNDIAGYQDGEKVFDVDGNPYETVRVTLGGGVDYDRVWLGQNLATARYNDGNRIPYITDSAAWANLNIGSGAMCAYGNNLLNVFE